jgi:hypothetical protein
MEPNTPIQTMPPQMPEPQKSNGALFGSIIVIIILILGGAYLWMQTKTKEAPLPASLAENDGTGSLDLQIPGGSSGDTLDLDSTEAELDNLDLESLDCILLIPSVYFD